MIQVAPTVWIDPDKVTHVTTGGRGSMIHFVSGVHAWVEKGPSEVSATIELGKAQQRMSSDHSPAHVGAAESEL